jgi:FkbM family methyltransferase
MLKFDDAQEENEEWWGTRLREAVVAYHWPVQGMASFALGSEDPKPGDTHVNTNIVLNHVSVPMFGGLPQPMVVVDVGANVGAFTYLASRVATNIMAYEPCRETYERLVKNVQERVEQPQRVTSRNLAVGATSGETVYMKKNLANGDYSGNAYSSADNDGDEPAEAVLTISLEDILLASPTPGRIDYLKVDCEGAEYEFLTNKDLSGIKYLELELHYDEPEKKLALREWINQTHDIMEGSWNPDHNLKATNRVASLSNGYGISHINNIGIGIIQTQNLVQTGDPLTPYFTPRVAVSLLPTAVRQELQERTDSIMHPTTHLQGENND